MASLTIPNNWKPRSYQKAVWNALETSSLRRFFLVWHRRAGKDEVCLHWLACCMIDKAATYWHMLPEAAQARKAIWDAVNPHTGKRRIDEAFPDALFKKRDNDMKITCRLNGAVYQLCGSDNYNSLVGSPPYGVIFSEFALADPLAWSYVQPILEENGGFAIFITTPRGRNHAHDFYKMAKSSPDWYCEKLDVNDTGIFDTDQLNRIKRELIAQYGTDAGSSQFEQEYYCSFEAALLGSYFGTEMNIAEAEGRIGRVPYDPRHLVYPCFDFGKGASNSTVIWFMQNVANEPRAIDYLEGNDGDIAHYAIEMKHRDYNYGCLILPHDGGYARLGTGLSYEEQFNIAGFETEVLDAPPSKELAIKSTASFIKMTYFNEEKVSRGVDGLRSYQRERDHAKQVFKTTPLHNWASHIADGFQTAAQGYYEGKMVSLESQRAKRKTLDMSNSRQGEF